MVLHNYDFIQLLLYLTRDQLDSIVKNIQFALVAVELQPIFKD